MIFVYAWNLAPKCGAQCGAKIICLAPGSQRQTCDVWRSLPSAKLCHTPRAAQRPPIKARRLYISAHKVGITARNCFELIAWRLHPTEPARGSSPSPDVHTALICLAPTARPSAPFAQRFALSAPRPPRAQRPTDAHMAPSAQRPCLPTKSKSENRL